MSLKGLVRHVRFIALIYNNLSLQRCCIFLHQGENKSQYVHASLNAVQLLTVKSRFYYKRFYKGNDWVEIQNKTCDADPILQQQKVTGLSCPQHDEALEQIK